MEINIFTGGKVINVEDSGNAYKLSSISGNDLITVKADRNEFNSAIETLKAK